MKMEIKILSLIFVGLQMIMLAGQITTLVSTYWTSWDLKFNWTKGMHYSRPEPDGVTELLEQPDLIHSESIDCICCPAKFHCQLISQGHAGLWSRCVRVYDLSWGESASMKYSCLDNYNTTNGSLQLSFGKVCKTATAALCVGDTAVILSIVIMTLINTFKSKSGFTLVKIILLLLLFEGMVCFTIPLLYLSGNMAELIDQLSGAYGLLLVVHMTPWYTHDWAFWTQVGLLIIWGVTVGVFVFLYSFKYALSKSKLKPTNFKETEDDTEMEALRN